MAPTNDYQAWLGEFIVPAPNERTEGVTLNEVKGESKSLTMEPEVESRPSTMDKDMEAFEVGFERCSTDFGFR